MVVLAKRSLGEILSAMELMDAHSLALVLRKQAWGLRNPLPGRCVLLAYRLCRVMPCSAVRCVDGCTHVCARAVGAS